MKRPSNEDVKSFALALGQNCNTELAIKDLFAIGCYFYHCINKDIGRKLCSTATGTSPEIENMWQQRQVALDDFIATPSSTIKLLDRLNLHAEITNFVEKKLKEKIKQ